MQVRHVNHSCLLRASLGSAGRSSGVTRLNFDQVTQTVLASERLPSGRSRLRFIVHLKTGFSTGLIIH